MHKISVAMATFNGGKYLQEQLESLADQSRPPDELVVCDDGSSDNTFDILDAFQRKSVFPIEVVRNEKRLGFTKNFEKAMSLCSGDLIFPCDQDDVWHPTKLQKHEAIYLEQADVGLVFNDARLVDAELKPLGKTWFQVAKLKDRQLRDLETSYAFRLLTPASRICGCMLSFRARFWDSVAPIPGQFSHDNWLAMCLSMVSRLRVIHEPLNDYRQNSNQATGGHAVDAEPRKTWSPSRADMLETRAIELTHILQHLRCIERSGSAMRYPGFNNYLRGQISHLWRRSSMSNNLVKRTPLVLIEFALGNYARYNVSVKNSLSYDIRPRFFR